MWFQKAEWSLKGRGISSKADSGSDPGELLEPELFTREVDSPRSNIGSLDLSLQCLVSGPFGSGDRLISVPPAPPADLAKSGSTNLFHVGEKDLHLARVSKGSRASSGSLC